MFNLLLIAIGIIIIAAIVFSKLFTNNYGVALTIAMSLNVLGFALCSIFLIPVFFGDASLENAKLISYGLKWILMGTMAVVFYILRKNYYNQEEDDKNEYEY